MALDMAKLEARNRRRMAEQSQSKLNNTQNQMSQTSQFIHEEVQSMEQNQTEKSDVDISGEAVVFEKSETELKSDTDTMRAVDESESQEQEEQDESPVYEEEDSPEDDVPDVDGTEFLMYAYSANDLGLVPEQTESSTEQSNGDEDDISDIPALNIPTAENLMNDPPEEETITEADQKAFDELKKLAEQADKNKQEAMKQTVSKPMTVKMPETKTAPPVSNTSVPPKPKQARIPSEKQDTRIRKTPVSRPVSVRNDPTAQTTIPSFPRSLVQEVRNVYRDATNNSDALAAFVYAQLGNPDLQVDENVRELVKANKEDNTLLNMEQRMRHLETLLYTLTDTVKELELALAFLIFDKVGFRHDIPATPYDINMFEAGITDVTKKMRESAEKRKAWENQSNGRPYR